MPIDGPGDVMKIFIESLNRTGVGPERAFYKFRSWRRWFVSGGEADVVFGNPAAPIDRTFTVLLHFAELEDVKPGERVFDVRLQGKDMVRSLDVVAAAGGPRKPLVREFKGIPASSAIRLSLIPSAGSKLPAILCGAEVAEEQP